MFFATKLSQVHKFDFDAKIAGNFIKIFPANLSEKMSLEIYLKEKKSTILCHADR